MLGHAAPHTNYVLVQLEHLCLRAHPGSRERNAESSHYGKEYQFTYLRSDEGLEAVSLGRRRSAEWKLSGAFGLRTRHSLRDRLCHYPLPAGSKGYPHEHKTDSRRNSPGKLLRLQVFFSTFATFALLSLSAVHSDLIFDVDSDLLFDRSKPDIGQCVTSLPDDRPIVVAVTAGRGGLHANTIRAYKEKQCIRAVIYDACNNPTLTRDMQTFLSGQSTTSSCERPT